MARLITMETKTAYVNLIAGTSTKLQVGSQKLLEGLEVMIWTSLEGRRAW